MNLTHITPPPYFDDNGVALEERCKTCQGYGYMQAGAWHVYKMKACGDCEGIGYTLTTRGLALLDFLRRHGFGGRP